MATFSPGGGGAHSVPISVGRGRGAQRADLGGVAAHGVLHVLLEDGVELVGARHALAREAHDEAATLGLLDEVVSQQVAQELAEVVGAHAVEVGEREHAARELRGGEFPLGGENRERLVAEQAVRKAIEARRLHPTLLAVELDEGYALQQLPGHGLRQQRARLGLVLAHDEPHLGRALAPPRAPHALQEARDRERGVDLERPLEPADVDAQLERGRCHDGEVRRLVAHPLLGALADGRRQVAMVDEKAVVLPVELAVRPKRRADLLGFFSRVAENEALVPPRVLKDVADARVGVGGRDVSARLPRGRHYLRAQFCRCALCAEAV